MQCVGSVQGVWAGFAYDGPAGAVVRAFKFGGRARLAHLMAAQIAANAPPELMTGAIVPVPVHPSHRRRRGIDHVHVLARALARRTGRDVRACLARTGDPRPQVGRSRLDRMRGPQISLAGEPPSTALILDDVVTTGATIASCIRVLKSAGCGQISAIAYARTTAR